MLNLTRKNRKRRNFHNRGPRRFVVESLERRELLSGMGVCRADGELHIGGHPTEADEVLVWQDKSNLYVKFNDADYQFDLQQFDRICFFGLGGDDRFQNLTGIDCFVDGGQGDDELVGGGGNDVLDGGAGNDTVSGQPSHDVNGDPWYGPGGDDMIFGGEGDDTLEGGADKDILSGGAGNDVLDGGTEDDFLCGGGGDDTLKGGNGADVLVGWTGNDVLSGGFGDDQLYGWYGNDDLAGGHGDDYLNGGHGFDKLLGGPGSDILHNGISMEPEAAHFPFPPEIHGGGVRIPDPRSPEVINTALRPPSVWLDVELLHARSVTDLIAGCSDILKPQLGGRSSC
jgi:hypothetical protein